MARLARMWRGMVMAALLATGGTSLAVAADGQAPPLLLVTPVMAEQSYLATSDGKVVHVWPSPLLPSGPARMDATGTLLRVDKDRLPASFNAPGATGGRITKTARDGTLRWSFSIATNKNLVHHDALELPNGNILALVWQRHEPAEAEEKGRGKDRLGKAGLWSECLWELRPEGSRGAKLVWEWKAWDHVRRIPEGFLPRQLRHFEPGERIDINGGKTPSPAWAGATRMEYHAELDQVLLTVGGMGGVWIVDHSTTTQENTGDAGGKGGKGGRLLYQWNGLTADLKARGRKAFIVDAEWGAGSKGAEPVLEVLRGMQTSEGQLGYAVERWRLPRRADGSYAMDDTGDYVPPVLLRSTPVSLRETDEVHQRPTALACHSDGAWALTMGYSGRTRWSVAEGRTVEHQNDAGMTTLRVSEPLPGSLQCCGAIPTVSQSKLKAGASAAKTIRAAPVLKSRLVPVQALPPAISTHSAESPGTPSAQAFIPSDISVR